MQEITDIYFKSRKRKGFAKGLAAVLLTGILLGSSCGALINKGYELKKERLENYYNNPPTQY